MATYTSTSGSYTTTLTVTQTSQSIPDNTSTLTYSLTLTKNSGYGLWNNNSCPWSITINGTTVSGTFTYDFRNYTTLTLKSSTTITVNHNNDGTKTVSVSASVNMNNPDYVSVMQPSGTLTLTTIPRASDVSVSTTNYSITSTSSSNGITYTITPKTSYYHKVVWTLNGSTTTINLTTAISSATIYTITDQTLLGKLTNTPGGTLSITVGTYSDSGLTNLVGENSVSADISVDGDYIKPTVSLGTIVLNTRASGVSTSIIVPVAGYTTAKLQWTTANSYGASSVTTYFSINRGIQLNNNSSTSSGGNVTTSMLPASENNYSITITAYAVDSRGISSAVVTKTGTVFGYKKPVLTLTAYRTPTNSSTTEDAAGTYAYINYSSVIVSNGYVNNQVVSTSCTYSGSISGTVTNPPQWVALAVNEYITITNTVVDRISSNTVVRTINVASFPLDLADDGAGAVGVGLGMVAELNMIKFGLNTHVYNDKYFIYHRSDNTTLALTNGQVVNSTRGSAASISDLISMASDVGVNIPFTCSPTTALSSTLSGYSQTGTFLGKKVDGADRIDYVMLAGNGSALAYGTINTNNSSVSYKTVATKDDIYYASGDTISISGDMVLSGQVSGRVVGFYLPTEKRLTNITSVSITALTLTLRGVGGYLDNMTTNGVDFTSNSYTNTVSIRPGGLYFTITYGAAIGNLTNNSPVAVYVQSLGVTLS